MAPAQCVSSLGLDRALEIGQAHGVLWKWHIFCCLVIVRSWGVTDHSLLLFSDDGWTAPLALYPVKDWSIFGKGILRSLSGENPARLNWAMNFQRFTAHPDWSRHSEKKGNSCPCCKTRWLLYATLLFSRVEAAGGVWNVLFNKYILCFILPSIQLSFLNSGVMGLLFHATQNYMLQVLPHESELQILQNPIC